ncbi:MAG TPA: rhodanese-like domain-containing protein [Mycobacterium sp.]
MDSDAVPQVDIGTVPPTFDESVILLDVREDDEWQCGHAPGALHIPMGQIPARIDEINSAATLYVVCGVGGRSQRVAQYLAQNGYSPVNVSGGMVAWAGAGRPVITDDGGVGVI